MKRIVLRGSDGVAEGVAEDGIDFDRTGRAGGIRVSGCHDGNGVVIPFHSLIAVLRTAWRGVALSCMYAPESCGEGEAELCHYGAFDELHTAIFSGT
jgi:hypothetical protein